MAMNAGAFQDRSVISSTTSSVGPRDQRLPRPVRASVVVWLAAVACGVLEGLVHLLLPDPPTAAELAVRFGIYAAIVALILALRSGRELVRWTLAVVLGGFGTASLIIEPLRWLVAGGSASTFLATAPGPLLLVAGLRALHLLCVFTALALMFRPRAHAFFRPS